MSDPAIHGAICPQCKRNMLKTRTCSNRTIELQGEVYNLIPYGSEQSEWHDIRCHDCGVKRGGYHHPRCDVEECPRCHGQLLGCYCEDE